MSGERRYRRPKVNKTAELFHRLTLQRDFQNELHFLRSETGIAVGGFDRVEDIDRWKSGTQHLPKYLKMRAAMFRKFRIVPTETAEQIFDTYALFKVFSSPAMLKTLIVSGGAAPANDAPIALSRPSEDEIAKVGRRFVVLKIYDYADRDGTVAFVRREWPRIKRMLVGRMSHEPVGRIRASLNIERDAIIYELYQNDRKELLKRAGNYVGPKDRDHLISQILKREYDTKISSAAAKKVGQRYKKKTGDSLADTD